MEETGRNKRKQGHLGLPACVCLCLGVAAQNPKLKAVSQTAREGTLLLISLPLSLFLWLSGAC